mmetsp:Transcript_75874/g.197819  ORF Transcript_75874/g.197819 Transcript_75874/m.197819 type:complete len:85 (+) Transcript_75874:398-652(+)
MNVFFTVMLRKPPPSDADVLALLLQTAVPSAEKSDRGSDSDPRLVLDPRLVMGRASKDSGMRELSAAQCVGSAVLPPVRFRNKA